MKKSEVLEGFAFSTDGEADMLLRWLDDATLGTRRRKALVIVGPMCSGKTTLLCRIAEYKGEAPCLYDGRGGIVPSRIGGADLLRRFREFEASKVIVVDDLRVRSNKALYELQIFAYGFIKRVREPRSTSKIVEFKISAPLAVAVSADDAERAEKWIQAESYMGDRSPYLLIHPRIAKQKKAERLKG